MPELSFLPPRPVWLIVTDEDRIFEIRSNEAKARRTAKTIGGYMIQLLVQPSDDYRRQEGRR